MWAHSLLSPTNETAAITSLRTMLLEPHPALHPVQPVTASSHGRGSERVSYLHLLWPLHPAQACYQLWEVSCSCEAVWSHTLWFPLHLVITYPALLLSDPISYQITMRTQHVLHRCQWSNLKSSMLWRNIVLFTCSCYLYFFRSKSVLFLFFFASHGTQPPEVGCGELKLALLIPCPLLWYTAWKSTRCLDS